MNRTTVCCAVALCAGLLTATPARAVTPGFVESFTGAGNTGGWQGGASAGTSYTNPGSDGVGGAGDGYLVVRNTALGNFGAYNPNIQYVGDWLAAGVTGIRFSLRDIGAFENFEIHISVGNGGVVGTNFWQYNLGFFPTSAWQTFTIDLTTLNPAQWTRIRGTGTLEQALRNVDRLHFRHDRSPYTPAPTSPIIGDMGIDEITLLPAPGAAGVAVMGLAWSCRRRRGR